MPLKLSLWYRSLRQFCPLGSIVPNCSQNPSHRTFCLENSGIDVCEENPDIKRIISHQKPSKFRAVPQCWVSDLSELDEHRVSILELHPDVFRTFPRIDLLHRNIVWQSTYRNVTFIKALTRAEMPGGGRKPWPQKGLGKARHGSIRSPLWHRGGISHGIRGPKTWFYMLPDSIRIAGLCVALTIKHAQDDVVIIDSFDSLPFEDPQFLSDLADRRNWGFSVLFVDTDDVAPRNLAYAVSELPSFNIMPLYGLNCYSILKHETLVFSLRAVKQVQERLLFHLNRAAPLHQKFKYMDYKKTLLCEGEDEVDDFMPPFL